MDSLVLSSLVPLSGEGILQEHVEPRNTHLCSVFSTLFAVRKNPLEKTGLPNLKKTKGGKEIEGIKKIFLLVLPRPPLRSCQCCSECIPLSWLVSTGESPQPAGVNVWSPSSFRSFNTDYSRPMRHCPRALLHARVENFSRTRLHPRTSTHTRKRKKERKSRWGSANVHVYVCARLLLDVCSAFER